MAFSGNGDGLGGPVANINVTPLVDVMLVLLVIFMITAPMLQQGVEVDLPRATTAQLKGTTEQIVLSIDQSGRVFLGAGNPVDLAELSKKATAIMQSRPQNERKIYIKGDRNIQYGLLMEIMSRLHAAGITQIGLVSAPLVEGSKSGVSK